MAKRAPTKRRKQPTARGGGAPINGQGGNGQGGNGQGGNGQGGNGQGGTGQGDAGPPERYRHGDVILSEPGADAGVFYRRVTTQSALDRYLARNQINQRQFDAGLKLYRLWRAVGGMQRVTLSYGPRVEGRHELSDRQALLHHQLTVILRAMAPLHGVLIHVCLYDEAARDWAVARGDAPQAGVVVLRLALDALADHWKL